MRNLAIALMLVTLACIPRTALAWSASGHHAIARITWKQLDDKQRLQVTKILRAHPHYDIYLAANPPKGLPASEWAFLRAATWSDWVRGPKAEGLSATDANAIQSKYNKGVWHYIDLPYIHPNDAGKFDEAKIRKEMLEPEFDSKGEPRHVLAALKQSMKLLLAEDTSDHDKAVRICWLFHLVGDLHQPLHAVGLMATKETFAPGFAPPGGDQGGNLIIVKAKPGDARTINLHAYWDGLLFRGEGNFTAVEGMVAKMLKDPQYQREQLPELKATEFLAWAEESLELCKTVVYKGDDGGFLKAAGKSGGMGGQNAADVPALPAGYQKRADEVAARRMVLAGYRLSDQLNIVFKN
ncbi:MAG TPA: S1/P1 nuclease [Gemmataceae bacterium]|nr:S1/P1 nuclease [Gemmataceae bacterium]